MSAPTNLVLFDLDNTLFDRVQAYKAWAQQFVESMGLDEVETEWLCEIDGDGFASRQAVWSKAKERFDLHQPVDELVAAYRADYLDACRPDEMVLEMVQRLRRDGWVVGIVTNGPVPQQADKAERLGLLRLVDGFCASGELGIEKPDPRIFHEVIRRCNEGDPAVQDGWWMVGDAPVPDISGGRSVGLRTIWLDRGRSWNLDHGNPPDVTVGSLALAFQQLSSSVK